MRSALVGALYLLLPLLGGAIVHGVCMGFDGLTFLKRPIDGGLTLRGRRVFGHSKTWRGRMNQSAEARNCGQMTGSEDLNHSNHPS